MITSSSAAYSSLVASYIGIGINTRFKGMIFFILGIKTSPVANIIKSVKRSMAGEYSRELSAKVFKGQCTLIEKGFRQGGPARFGLRRALIDEHRAYKGLWGGRET